jgi:hypothetical protein
MESTKRRGRPSLKREQRRARTSLVFPRFPALRRGRVVLDCPTSVLADESWLEMVFISPDRNARRGSLGYADHDCLPRVCQAVLAG